MKCVEGHSVSRKEEEQSICGRNGLAQTWWGERERERGNIIKQGCPHKQINKYISPHNSLYVQIETPGHPDRCRTGIWQVKQALMVKVLEKLEINGTSPPPQIKLPGDISLRQHYTTKKKVIAFSLNI